MASSDLDTADSREHSGQFSDRQVSSVLRLVAALLLLGVVWPLATAFLLLENASALWGVAIVIAALIAHWVFQGRTWRSILSGSAIILWVACWAFIGPRLLSAFASFDAYRKADAAISLAQYGLRVERGSHWRIASVNPSLDDDALEKCIPMIRSVAPAVIDVRTSSIGPKGLTALQHIPRLECLLVSGLTAEEAREVSEKTGIPDVVVRDPDWPKFGKSPNASAGGSDERER